MLSEISPNGEEYFRFFRQECRRRGVSIAAVETVSQSPENLATNLDNLRRVEPDALVYMGYGMLAAKGLLREALDELGWDPPRIMGTAFMFYLMGFDKFEGWVGIDQFDPRNPLVEGFHERFVARYGQDPPLWPNAIPVLAYDTARVLVEGLFRAPILSGPGSEGRARDDPLHAEHDRRRAHAHRVLARTSTGCSAATGCSTAACATARSSSKDSSNPEPSAVERGRGGRGRRFAVARDRAPDDRVLTAEPRRVAHGAHLAQRTEALVELALDDLQPVLIGRREAEAAPRSG